MSRRKEHGVIAERFAHPLEGRVRDDRVVAHR